jgi:catechol 2,3-dioxygenase-like lactoylglutathione lyase family enzyme
VQAPFLFSPKDLLLALRPSNTVALWGRTKQFPSSQIFQYSGRRLMHFQTIPILRIFDEAKAKEFYLGFLGMSLDWEHRFEPETPLYLQVSKGNLLLHLSEHSGDCSPGAKVFINVTEFDELFSEISQRKYKYNRPSVEVAPWGDRTFTLIDPFSNKILFNEVKSL